MIVSSYNLILLFVWIYYGFHIFNQVLYEMQIVHFKDQQYHFFLISFFIKVNPLFIAISKLVDGNYLAFILGLLGLMSLLLSENSIEISDFKTKLIYLISQKYNHFMATFCFNLRLICSKIVDMWEDQSIQNSFYLRLG